MCANENLFAYCKALGKLHAKLGFSSGKWCPKLFHWTPEMRVCRSPLRHLVPLLLLSLSLPSPRAYRSVSPCSLTCFALRGHTIPGVIRMRCGIASPVAKAEIGAFSNSFAMKILYSSGTWLICFHKFPVSTSNVEHLEATCRALCEASSLHGGGHAAWPGRPEGGREGRRIPIKPTLWPLAPSSDMNGSLSARQTPTQQPRLSPLPPPLLTVTVSLGSIIIVWHRLSAGRSRRRVSPDPGVTLASAATLAQSLSHWGWITAGRGGTFNLVQIGFTRIQI